MTFKLTKKEEAERGNRVNALIEAGDRLQVAVETAQSAIAAAAEAYRAAVAAEREKLVEYVDDYNMARDALTDWCSGIAADWDNEYDEHSEKWQESDAATLARAFIDTYNDVGSGEWNEIAVNEDNIDPWESDPSLISDEYTTSENPIELPDEP